MAIKHDSLLKQYEAFIKKQLKLFEQEQVDFGGSLLLNKRHEKRNLSIKCPIHMVLKTNIATCGNLRKHKKIVDEQILKWSKKFGIKTYNHSVQIDHVHFNMLISSIDNYKKFIRALTGRLAQLLKVKFRYRPFTKLIHWGRQFKNVLNYLIQNEEEVTGKRPYKPRIRRPIRI